MNELIKEVVKSKGRRCTCIAYEVECDNCPFGDIDCTDKDLIYNIAKSLIKETDNEKTCNYYLSCEREGHWNGPSP